MNYIANARKLRPILEQAVQSLDDAAALDAPELYPAWRAYDSFAADIRVRRCGKLWRCLQAHTAQTGWAPENAPALWEQVNETHGGTADDPIPYEGNMVLQSGTYYSQDGAVYLCIRDTGSPVYNALKELVGIYVDRLTTET